MITNHHTQLLLTLLSIAVSSISQTAHGNPRIINMPVQWEATRNEFRGNGTATLTESFRETWIFHFESMTHGMVTSDRHTATFSGVIRPSKKKFQKSIPDFIIISERDFKKLIGLPTEPATPENLSNGKLLTLPMSSPGTALDDFTFRHIKGQSFSVRLLFM